MRQVVTFSSTVLLLFALVYVIWRIYFFTSIEPSQTNPNDVTIAFSHAMLTERMGQGIAAPTQEEIQEEQQVEMEQVAAATDWLHAADAKQRVAGAAQLAAYPTAEAEKQLREALTGDVDAEVRVTAANSLGYFDKLAPETIKVLLKALHDENDIAQNALNVLISHLSRMESGKSEFKKLAASIKTQAQNRQLSESIRTAILLSLNDQGVK